MPIFRHFCSVQDCIPPRKTLLATQHAGGVRPAVPISSILPYQNLFYVYFNLQFDILSPPPVVSFSEPQTRVKTGGNELTGGVYLNSIAPTLIKMFWPVASQDKE